MLFVDEVARQPVSVLLLGERVRRSFELPKVLIHPISVDGVTYRQLPHPSGRNLFYNSETVRDLIAMVLSEEARRITDV